MAFNQVFGPEKQPDKIDLKAGFGVGGKLRWRTQEDWADGQINNIGDTANSSTYLYRTITVDSARQVALSLGSDDGIKVWHNGKQVLANNVGRPAMPDQEKLTLDLTPGVNHVLMKISNGAGLTGFYFKLAEGAVLPGPIAAAINVAPDKRTPEQKSAVREYYRSLDPGLRPLRDKLRTLKSQFGSAFPPVAKRKEVVALSVAIDPQPGFTAPVTVTLEGFSTGRDPGGNPAPITNQIDSKPATLSSSNSLGIVSFTPKEQCELGTRTVVLRAETKVGDVTYIQYSPAFELTVKQ
jgi:hypothetical protein